MKAIDKGEMMGALLVDLSKAFDTVYHQKLLANIGCIIPSFAWFVSYLTDRFHSTSCSTSCRDRMEASHSWSSPRWWAVGLVHTSSIPTSKIYQKKVSLTQCICRWSYCLWALHS